LRPAKVISVLLSRRKPESGALEARVDGETKYRRIISYFDSVVTQSVLKCGSEDKFMNITIEAVYEAGVFKPLSPVENLKEHDKVRLVVEPANLPRKLPVNLIDAQRQNRIQIDPAVAREIGDSPEDDLLEG
jgi:predicted DNA-binding antitoxin AbrB/MazE fold protein